MRWLQYFGDFSDQIPKAIIAPVNIHLDFDAGTVDEMLDRLTVLRAQMLPKLQQQRSGTRVEAPRTTWTILL